MMQLNSITVMDTITYRKKLGAKRWLLLGLILISFASGLFGMILDHIPMVLILHRAISIVLVFFLAIHIFVFHKSCTKQKTAATNTCVDGSRLMVRVQYRKE